MSFLLPPNEAQLEFIRNEDVYQPPAKLEEDVTQLIEWLSKQPHLPNVTDRKWLLHFIIGCKYSLQKSKQVIESNFIVRAEHPELYGSFTEEEFKEATIEGMISAFPKLTPDGYRVIHIRTLPTADDYKYNAINLTKGLTAVLDLQLKEQPVNRGIIFLLDLKHFRMADFLVFTPATMKNMVKCFYMAFPLRVKSLHYINPPAFISTVVSFFKMFLTSKLKERIFIHDSLETLYEYIPKEVLPDLYGGFGGSVEKNERSVFELLMANKKWLDDRPKADLSKIPKHRKSDDLGMNGTFKKLQID